MKKSSVDYDFEWQTPEGAGDMLKSVYDSDGDGIVDNAEKVNGFTVGTNVPTNAKFTDTVYTHPAGTNPHGTTKADVDLGNVNNTSDANKPISTATQTALNLKFDKTGGRLTAGTGDVNIELWRGTSASWNILNSGGFLRFQSNYTTIMGAYFDALKLDYNTGNALFKGTVTAPTFIGALTGNAATATALTTNAGGTTRPVYFSGGKPIQCSYTLGTTVPSNAIFTDTH